MMKLPMTCDMNDEINLDGECCLDLNVIRLYVIFTPVVQGVGVRHKYRINLFRAGEQNCTKLNTPRIIMSLVQF